MGISFVVVVIIALLFASVRITKEYERGVIYRLGRLIEPKGPGLFFLIPILDTMVKMDMRTLTFELPAQEVITRDNVTVKVTAVVYFRILDPSAAVTRVADYRLATVQLAQTTLRNVLGQFVLDELLAERAQINVRLQQIIDEGTEPWGIKVSAVEIKDIELPANMQRAMARQAEAEREKRAKIILAEAEFQAAAQLTEAAAKIAEQPIALQLRYLTTLYDISSEKTTTIVFPLPLDLLDVFLNHRKQG